MIEIYTDGSCIGNPGPGGWGAIILADKKYIVSGNEPDTTNNRMEMKAIIAALKWLKTNNISDPVTIHSDSNLIVQTMNKGWKKKANTDLWEMIDSLAPELNLTWKWVKAHATNKLNNEVDKIAFSEAEKAKKSK